MPTLTDPVPGIEAALDATSMGQSKELHDFGMAMGHAPVADKVALIDFDATLVQWGPLMADKDTFEGAKEGMLALRAAGYRLVIFTSRLSEVWAESVVGQNVWTIDRFLREQRDYIAAQLARHDIPWDDMTAEKRPSEFYLDDSAMAFRGDWSRVMLSFERGHKKDDEAIMAYLAGFFDGEGSIGVYAYARRNNGGGAFGSLAISASQVDRHPLDTLVQRFGGSLRLNRKSRTRPVWQWKLNGPAASNALRHMLPFLIVKRQQAELAIRFQSLVRGGKLGNLTPLTEAEKLERLDIIARLRELKHGG
jgi:hypothetical protein